jgi:glutathione S-transferase
MSKTVLHIGNKNYSSWSLRPWLALRWAGIPFEEVVIPLGGPGYGKSRIPAVLAVSPSGKVPSLHADGITVWDSLAICEWTAERSPSLWPKDPQTRAIARSASAEMHAGFAALRRDLSMNIRRRAAVPRESLPEDTQADLARLETLWGALREHHGAHGPWLFGQRSVADAMYAPVCTRLVTYGISVSPVASAYCDTLYADPDFQAWAADAEAEPMTVAQTDALFPGH